MIDHCNRLLFTVSLQNTRSQTRNDLNLLFVSIEGFPIFHMFPCVWNIRHHPSLQHRSRLSTPDPTRFEAIKPLDAWKTEFLVKVQRCWELWLYGCIMGMKMGSLFGQGYNWVFPTWIIWQVVWEPYGRGRCGFKLIKLIASPGGWRNLCDISVDSLENWMSMFRFDVHLPPPCPLTLVKDGRELFETMSGRCRISWHALHSYEITHSKSLI